MKQNIRFNIISVVIILSFTTLIYSNTFQNSFQYDDERVLFHNPAIKNLNNYTNLPNINSQLGIRPVLDLTFALNYSFGGFNLFGYHLANLLIHLAVCILLYFITCKIFLREYSCQKNEETKHYKLVPLFSALLFAIHPINSQAVNYISARSASLCVLFMLISLYLFIKFLDLWVVDRVIENRKLVNSQHTPQNGTNCLSVKFKSIIPCTLSVLSICSSIAAFMLALGVKKMAVCLPLILICFDCYFYNRSHITTTYKSNGKHTIINFLGKARSIIIKFRLYHIPYWSIIVFGFIKLSKFDTFNFYVPLHVNILTACKTYVYYIKLLFFPVGLSIEHHFPVATSFSSIPNIVSICVVVILGMLAVFLFKRLKIVSFSIILYFIAPIATSSVLIISYSSMTSLIAEHRIYASSIGFCLSILVLVYSLSKYFEKKRIIKFLCRNPYFFQCSLIFPLITFYSITTFKRNFDWKDGLSLWSKAVECYPESARAQYNLGQEYTKRGNYEKSIRHYAQSLKQDYNDFQTHNNLGIAYKENGELDKAIEEFKIATILKKNYGEAHFNLAITLEEKGDINSAIEEYNISLGLKSDNIIAIYNLGNIFVTKGDMKNAELMFEKAIKIAETKTFNNIEIFDRYYKSTLNEVILKAKDTVISKSLNNLGSIYMSRGDLDVAITMYNKAIEIRDDASIHYNLGRANHRKGLIEIAESEYKLALKLNGNIAGAHNSLGIIHSQQEQYDKAVEEFKIAVSLKPNYANAHKNLGLVYLEKEDFKKAVFHFSETIRLDPDQKEIENIKLLLKSVSGK